MHAHTDENPLDLANPELSAFHRTPSDTVAGYRYQIADMAQMHDAIRRFDYEHEDRRDMIAQKEAALVLSGIYQSLARFMADFGTDYDIERLLEGQCHLAHRNVTRLRNQISDAIAKVKECESAQDGSEVLDSQLQQEQDRCFTLEQSEEAWERMLDAAVTTYTDVMGSVWAPTTGTDKRLHTLTATVFAGNDWIARRQRTESQANFAAGTPIIVTGGRKFTDATTIFRTLDSARKKHPDMILVHGGAEGADRIAGAWARQKNVTQVVYKPDWTIGKAAGYRRNEKMLAEARPAGVIAFPGDKGTKHMIEIATAAKVNVWRPVNGKPAPAKAAADTPAPRRVIKRIGGGWFQLPDGRKIQGKDAAIAEARAA
jgi:hypothetical protein